MSVLNLIIGNKNYSSWSLRPWVFLKQNKIEFSEKRIALFTASSDQELSGYNSNSKVPVLVDNDVLIWDSLSILEYISEQYLKGNGWPQEVNARALARSISCEMHSSFFNVREAMPMNCRKKFKGFHFSPDVVKDIERITALWQQCRTQYGKQGEWLFGNYSIADAMFAPVALRFDSYDVPLQGVEKDYVQSVLNQTCIIEWIAAGTVEKEIIGADEV